MAGQILVKGHDNPNETCKCRFSWEGPIIFSHFKSILSKHEMTLLLCLCNTHTLICQCFPCKLFSSLRAINNTKIVNICFFRWLYLQIFKFFHGNSQYKIFEFIIQMKLPIQVYFFWFKSPISEKFIRFRLI